MTVILSDKGQKKGKHSQKEKWFADNGYEIVPAPLPVGDYVLGTPAVMAVMERKARRGIAVRKMDFIGSYKVAIDTKRDMQELYQDIVSDHGRFRDECILAQQNDIKLYILVENLDNISLDVVGKVFVNAADNVALMTEWSFEDLCALLDQARPLRSVRTQTTSVPVRRTSSQWGS